VKGQETSGIIRSLETIPNPEGCPKRVSDEPTAPVTPENAFDRLQAFILYLPKALHPCNPGSSPSERSSKEPRRDMECFERELHEYVVAAEREVLAEELARLDVDLPAVTIEG
jgi:hypothetical protein